MKKRLFSKDAVFAMLFSFVVLQLIDYWLQDAITTSSTIKSFLFALLVNLSVGSLFRMRSKKDK